MFDHDTYSALQTAHERILEGTNEFDKENPTHFIKGVLEESGLEIQEEFHAHAVMSGEGLPDERPHGTEDREVYFLKLDGSMEYHFIKGQSGGMDMAELNKGVSCCHCTKCCVVEVK